MDPTKIRTLIARSLRVPLDDVRDDATIKDLVDDSFALIDLIIELQEELGVRLVQEDLRGVASVGDLCAVLQRRAA